jgi:hypothetical protein
MRRIPRRIFRSFIAQKNEKPARGGHLGKFKASLAAVLNFPQIADDCKRKVTAFRNESVRARFRRSVCGFDHKRRNYA